MKFIISVPAIVNLVLEIDAKTKSDALELFHKGEFDIFEKNIVELDFDCVENLFEYKE